MEESNSLFIDREFAPKITGEEAARLMPLINDFVDSYQEKDPSVPTEQWLQNKLAQYLPTELAATSATEIVTTVRTQQEQKESLKHAIFDGRSKEGWFAYTVQSAVAHMGTEYVAQYLQSLDAAMSGANAALYDTLLTGAANGNPNLDGLIAEQYHVQTFNLNAEAAGSPYRAVVPEHGYGEIRIVDGNGQTVAQYQSRYGADAKAGEVLRAPDGTTSNPLTKDQAKQLQQEAQNGNWRGLDWNEYQLKDLAMGVGKQAAHTALLAVAIGAGFSIANSLWQDEKIKPSQVMADALRSGADAGLIAAVAGAVKVGAEKGILRFIPQGTPAGIIANVVFVGFENAKILSDYAQGTISLPQCLGEMEMTTVSTTAGIVLSGWTAAQVGGVCGLVFGPVGAAFGSVLGGIAGFMGGAKVGQAMVRALWMLRQRTGGLVPAMMVGAKNVKAGVESFCQKLSNISNN